jgi:hypothetical protein
MIAQKLRILSLSTMVVFGIAGCATNSSNTETQTVEPSQAQKMDTSVVPELYEVHHEGRIYFFYDSALYKSFLKTGHTAYMVARIAAGPKGETLKFALTGKDKKKLSGIPSIDLLEGNAKPGEPFYGEMRSEGRIYVFNNFQDMSDVRKVGEAPYRFTEIGTGPKGETVVYVLNKTNKKKKPVALIDAFKKKNGLN